jgi:DNA-binding transcriptional regulator PaaX
MRANRSEIANIILSVLKAAGIIFLSLAAPNIFFALKDFNPKLNKYNSRRIKRSIDNLQDNNYLLMERKNGFVKLRLTKKGQEKANVNNIKEFGIKKPKKWDGKWRIIIFDVPERYGKKRTGFREDLRVLGFVCVQKSVWAHPYHCQEEVLALAKYHRIERCLVYFTAEKISNEKKLKNKFDLT